MAHFLADGAGSPIDQGVATFLFIGTLLFGWVAWWRLRGKGFRRVPTALAWAFGGTAMACLVLAFVLPPIIRPAVSARPSSPARITIVSPTPGEVFHGTGSDPANITVRLQLTGARIVSVTSTRLRPDQGHIHLMIDGALVSMAYGLVQTVESVPGNHVLTVEFVAVDHGPFNPRVIAQVSFAVEP